MNSTTKKYYQSSKLKLYSWQILVVCLFFASTLNAQLPGRLNDKSLKKEVSFTVTQYSTQEGLIQSQIACIVPRTDGALFLSTANGISLFNGFEFKEPIPNKKYRTLFFPKLFWNKNHNILFGVSGTLVQLYPTFKTFDVGGGDLSRAICVTNDSVFFTNKKNELFLGTLPNFTSKKIQITIPHTINYINYYKNELYCATDSGLYRYNLQTKKILKISNDQFVCIKANPYNEKLYGLTNQKVQLISNEITTLLDIHPKSNEENCQDIEFINSYDYYVATSKGLFYSDGDYSEQFNEEDGIISNDIISLYYNKEENCLFAGTGEKGLLKLQFKNAYSLYKREGFNSSSLSSLIKTHANELLFSSICCNIHQIKIDTVLNYNNVEGNFSSLSEIDSLLFCGTWGGGLLIMNKSKLLYTIKPPNISGTIVFASFKDSHNNYWIGTDKGIASAKSITQLKPVFTSQIKTKINCVFELKNGNICLGGEDGFYIVQENKIIHKYGKEEGLIAKEVRSFLEDQEGKLWVGTYGGGMYCLENEKLTSINKLNNCMLFEDAFTLAINNYNQIYMSSNFGLWSISYTSLDNFYKGKTNFLIPFQFTQENGVLNTEFNGGFQNNYLKTSLNHFYFPTLEGVVILTPDSLILRKLYPKIELTKGTPFKADSSSTAFKQDNNFITFKVSCVNFSNKNNVYFQYKLLSGNETKEWSAPQKDNNFSFYLLPPNKYKFIVRAIDAYNDPAPLESIYEFEILPYFYETNWFKILILILFFTLTTVIVRTRMHRFRKIAEEKEAIKRKESELELVRIQSQMNPHFVFNCLNTIQSLFIAGETKLANEYTTNFSKLMRIIIEHLRKKTISIREEIEMLEVYLPLESMQLENAFIYEILVDSKIDKDRTFIHGMIIHTFVENAIKHGVIPIKDKIGIILIHFKKIKDGIVVEISDNGPGLNATLAKKAKNGHISRGLQIIKEKIDIINLLENIDIKIESLDLNDLDKSKTGTIVRITYPTKL